MTHFPQTNPSRRATRIQLGNAVSAMVMLADGRRAKARIHTVSETGGLLRMARALADGDFVEVAFQTQSGPVSGMAEMLHTMQKSEDSVLQAFRFVAMEDDDHKTLTFAVSSTSERNFLLGSNQYSR